MIVRILGEGQYDLEDHALDALNGLDSQIERAIESGDGELARGAATWAAPLDRAARRANAAAIAPERR